jgi:RNA polymerase sigma factor (sigma-70 family)
MATQEHPAPAKAAAAPGPIELDPRQLELLGAGVRVIALRALGDADAAADVAQETLARAVDALRRGRLADPAKLSAFVRGIAHNVIADLIRSRARAPSVPVSESLDLPSAEPNALDALLSAEEIARLGAAFAALSEGDRRLLRDAYFEGLSSAEVAARLGEPDARVRKRRSRALERLRRAFLGEPDAKSQSAPDADFEDDD